MKRLAIYSLAIAVIAFCSAGTEAQTKVRRSASFYKKPLSKRRLARKRHALKKSFANVLRAVERIFPEQSSIRSLIGDQVNMASVRSPEKVDLNIRSLRPGKERFGVAYLKDGKMHGLTLKRTPEGYQIVDLRMPWPVQYGEMDMKSEYHLTATGGASPSVRLGSPVKRINWANGSPLPAFTTTLEK